MALHDRDPGRPHSDGLVMVIDQDETPLFLGAIHRLLHGVRLDDLMAAATAAGAEVTALEDRVRGGGARSGHVGPDRRPGLGLGPARGAARARASSSSSSARCSPAAQATLEDQPTRTRSPRPSTR